MEAPVITILKLAGLRTHAGRNQSGSSALTGKSRSWSRDMDVQKIEAPLNMAALGTRLAGFVASTFATISLMVLLA